MTKSGSDSRTVLVVSTDDEVLGQCQRVFAQRRWQVLTAGDFVRAQTIARQEVPAVVLVDGALPAGGAARLLQRLRTSLATAFIPAVALADSEAARAELTAAGAQASLLTPVADGDLERAVDRLLADTSPKVAPAAVLGAPARIRAVRDSGLIDSPPEAVFDLLTRIAAALLGAPTALLSIVDADRQFFKSAVGLEEPLRTARQSPLTFSLCQWAVVSSDTFVVDNAQQHPLVRHNPAVQSLRIGAYAGVPLHDPASHAIGSFCVVDSRTRKWTETELATLHDLTLVARAELTARHVGGSTPAQYEPAAGACRRLVERSATAVPPEDHRALVALCARLDARVSGS